jgi:PAS domain-containing protein
MVGLNYYTLLDRIPEALIILNPEDEIIFFNRKAREFEKAVSASIRNGI